MAKRLTADPTAKISRDDLEREFRSLQGEAREMVDEQSNKLITMGVVGVVIVVVIIFLLGRRAGRRKNTYIEIRRV
jgi:hypothetical protein